MEINHFINQGLSYNLKDVNSSVRKIFKDLLDRNNKIDVINIIQVSDEALLEINQKHLNHDYFTDIITFETSNKPKEVELYISYERAIDNSPKNPNDEILRLIFHGCLHICGYNDKTQIEKNRMRTLEDLYLKFHVEQKTKE